MSRNGTNADGITVSFILAILVLIAIAVAGGLSGCAAPRPLARPEPLVHVEYVDESDILRDALVNVWRATVLVKVDDERGDEGGATGSGVLVAADDGPIAFILTADHVVTPDDGATRTKIEALFPDGKKLLGRVWSEDHWHDLALVELFGHVETSPVHLAREVPRLLDRVWDFGAPTGEPGHVGQGRWGRLRPLMGRPRDPIGRTITGGFIWPGMSGGPVVNARGELVGIVATCHLADAEDAGDDDPQVRVPQMGGAVDWKDVREFLARAGVR